MVYCVQSVGECTVSVIRVRGGTLVTVGCRMRNFDRKRTEVVKARHFHRVIGEEPLNTFPQREADSVAEFDAVKTEAKNFAQHFVALRVAARISTGREGYRPATDALPCLLSRALKRGKCWSLRLRRVSQVSFTLTCPGDQSQFMFLNQVRMRRNDTHAEP